MPTHERLWCGVLVLNSVDFHWKYQDSCYSSRKYEDSCSSIFRFMCMFCRSLLVPLYFFFWSLCCLFFFDIRIPITQLVSSNSSYSSRKYQDSCYSGRLIKRYLRFHNTDVIEFIILSVWSNTLKIDFMGIYANLYRHAIHSRKTALTKFPRWRKSQSCQFMKPWHCVKIQQQLKLS